MTPREPDRFEAKAKELCLTEWRPIAAALRTAESSALERAARECDEEAHDEGNAPALRERYANMGHRIRALASPAAARAAETWRAEGPNGTRRICPVCQRWYWRRGSQEGERCDAADCFSHSWNDAPPSEPAPLLPRVLAVVNADAKHSGDPALIYLAAELRAYIADREGKK